MSMIRMKCTIILALVASMEVRADEDLVALTPDTNGRLVEASPANLKTTLLTQLEAWQNIESEQLEAHAPLARQRGWSLEQLWVGANLRLSYNILTILKGNISPGGFLIFKPRKRQ